MYLDCKCFKNKLHYASVVLVVSRDDPATSPLNPRNVDFVDDKGFHPKTLLLPLAPPSSLVIGLLGVYPFSMMPLTLLPVSVFSFIL
jgi:hypothetical protein